VTEKKPPGQEFDPAEDGVTHINCYSAGKTELGKLLSNFAHVPFTHPEHGHFASMEGYWYWCGSGRSHDHLRRLYGMSAKSAGVKCDPVPIPEEEFHDMIREGMRCKIAQNPRLMNLFRLSKLPFVHYFVYGGKVVHKDKHDWQMEWLEQIRREYQPDYVAEQLAMNTQSLAERKEEARILASSLPTDEPRPGDAGEPVLWIRYRFQANWDDPHPDRVPSPGPWWIVRQDPDEDFSVIDAFLPQGEDLLSYWPEAEEIEIQETVAELLYSDERPQPSWFKPNV
jgi:hypothetical protein